MQPFAPVKEKQQRQDGSAGHQDLQQEIRAQLPPSSTQDLQTNQYYLHLRLPLALSISKPSRSSLPSRTGELEIDRPGRRSYSMPGSQLDAATCGVGWDVFPGSNWDRKRRQRKVSILTQK
jgi:hypothetical protein